MKVKIQPVGKAIIFIFGVLILYALLSVTGLFNIIGNIFTTHTIPDDKKLTMEDKNILNRPLVIGILKSNYHPSLLLANGGLNSTNSSIFGKNYNLKVQIKEYLNSEKMAEDFYKGGDKSGNDFVITGLDQIPVHYSKIDSLKPVIPFVLQKDNLQNFLIARSYITSIKYLIGRKIAVVKNSSSHYFLLEILKKNNIDRASVQIVYTNSDKESFNKFNKREATACVSSDLNVLYQSTKQSDYLVLVSPIPVPMNNISVLLAKESFLKDYSNTSKKLLQGILASNDSIIKESGILNELIADHYLDIPAEKISKYSPYFSFAGFADQQIFLSQNSNDTELNIVKILERQKIVWGKPEIKNLHFDKIIYPDIFNSLGGQNIVKTEPVSEIKRIESIDTVKSKDSTTEKPITPKIESPTLSAVDTKAAVNINSTEKPVTPKIESQRLPAVDTKAAVNINSTEKPVTPKNESQRLPAVDTKAALNLNSKKHVIYFDTNSYKITTTSQKYLDEFAGIIKQNKNNKIDLIGNTDSTGEDVYNFMLSKWRSKAVADYLIKNHQLPESQFNIIGNGSRNPVSSNKSEKTRKPNRRVDIVIRQR